jgi:CRP-like cAMP-binding protein
MEVREYDLTTLKKVIDSVHKLNEEEWQAFAGIWKPVHFKRKQVITTAGSKENYLYFVSEGVQRVYYFDEQEREATLVFTYASSFGGVVDALLTEQDSKYFYETISDSTLLQAPYIKLKQLMQQYQPIETLVRKLLSLSLSGLLERLVELQCFSSEEKFRKLLKRSPHILQLVPHKYLANYLGINATNFSKLMNSIRI